MSQPKQSRLKVYNTLTRHLDDFEPIHPGRVNMFVCGPTVYDVSKFAEYGKLSRQNLEQLTVHRVDPDPEKRNPGDFVLWKNQKPGEIAWDSPWGKGRPGWHIEDTAITLTHFGPTYDLHGGGTELIFPHHEAEIAQAEGLTGKKPLATYWAHTGLISIKGKEMHKSLGNFVPIQDAIQKVGVEALRVLYASTHYRSPLDYTEDTLVQADSLARRFRRAYDQVQIAGGIKSESKDQLGTLKPQVDEARTEFFTAMDDDFNTPRALAAYIRIVGIAEGQGRPLSAESAVMLLETMNELSSILGLLETDSVPRREFLELVNMLTSLRNELRAKHEYALSDRLREQMQKAGVLVEDEAK